VATLLLNPSQLYWERLPTNLYEFLFAYPGRATYRFDIRIDAESARQRIVPVEFIFDPTSSDLEYVRLVTRYPWWRLLRWLRSRLHYSRPSANNGSAPSAICVRNSSHLPPIELSEVDFGFVTAFDFPFCSMLRLRVV
jgi:hypothetical protein